jgi:hypothetical protein
MIKVRLDLGVMQVPPSRLKSTVYYFLYWPHALIDSKSLCQRLES